MSGCTGHQQPQQREERQACAVCQACALSSNPKRCNSLPAGSSPGSRGQGLLACLQQGLAHGSRAAGPQVLRHLLCVRGGRGARWMSRGWRNTAQRGCGGGISLINEMNIARQRVSHACTGKLASRRTGGRAGWHAWLAGWHCRHCRSCRSHQFNLRPPRCLAGLLPLAHRVAGPPAAEGTDKGRSSNKQYGSATINTQAQSQARRRCKPCVGSDGATIAQVPGCRRRLLQGTGTASFTPHPSPHLRCASCAIATPSLASPATLAAASATPAFRFRASATGPWAPPNTSCRGARAGQAGGR